MPDPVRPPPTARQVPDRVTMPLLELIAHQSLDEGYQHAADQRRAGAPLTPSTRARAGTGVAVAVLGLLVSVAAVQTSRNAEVDDANRATLIERIEGARERAEGRQARITELQGRTSALSERLRRVTEEEQAARARLRRLQVPTGFVAVRGEGVRIVVDDGPGGDPDQVVRDSDLALLVNGYWAAGAEAIAINGQRLTAFSPIRNSGVPIEVNGLGIAPPYRVEVIGDNRGLQADFAETDSGGLFAQLARDFGFVYEVDNDDDLLLPPGPAQYLDLRVARATGPPEGGAP